jgi:hypothetical protein
VKLAEKVQLGLQIAVCGGGKIEQISEKMGHDLCISTIEDAGGDKRLS